MKAVSIGELAVDWLSLERGQDMMSARTFYRYLGGNASNVAVGLARLGLDSAIISKIGEDIHGDYLLSCLRQESVDVSFVITDRSQVTAQCYMTRELDGSPCYFAWPSPNASKTLKPEDLPDQCFKLSWIWHAAAVSFIAKPRRYAMLHAIENARKHNKIISFDACFPNVDSDAGRKAAWQCMQLSDILKFNLKEAAYWSNMPENSDPDLMVRKLMENLNPAVLIVTLAEKGAILYKDSEKAFRPAFEVQSIGDVGPGDAFSAGLIYGLSTLKEKGMQQEALAKLDINDWFELSSYAACAGALVTRSYSATESFPKLDELNLALGKTSPGP